MRSSSTPGLVRKYFALFLLPLSAWTATPISFAQPTAVRQRESDNRGFLVLRNQSGVTVGSGEFIQVAHRNSMNARLILRFKDGSVDDEMTEYSQDRSFHLISYHHIQRGPYFPHPIDASIDLAAQQIKTIPLDKQSGFATGAAQSEHMELPVDLGNGLVLTLLKNLQGDAKQIKFPYLAFSPKARLVKLAISNITHQSFRIGGRAFRADHYTIRPELGGLAGIIAPIIGKQPADLDVWLAAGKVPALVRVDGALYDGGPILSIQLAAPSW